MTDDEIKNRVKMDEGYRSSVYFDTKGIPTAGWGHAFLKGSHIPYEVSRILFEDDFQRAVNGYNLFVKVHRLSLNEARRGIIINMIFQMGYRGVSRFKNMIAYLKIEDYENAANEMLDSKWSRNHRLRSGRLAKQMKEGSV